MSRSVIAAAVCLVVLAGCGGTTEPSAPPTSEDALTTATAAPPDVVVETTEAVTSEEPEETEDVSDMDQSEEGAEAFVEHYFETLNDARATGETERVAALADETCESCANFEETARAGNLRPLDYEVHDSVLTGDMAVVRVDVVEKESSGTAVFDLKWEDGWTVQTVKAEA